MSPLRWPARLPASWWTAAGLAAMASAAAATAAPAPGRYDGELCVRTAAAEPGCGPAAATLGANGELRLQLSDIVYRLKLRSSQLDMVLMHGNMQIDGFSATYEWQGDVLVFADPDKAVSYRVRLAPRKR
jgi:hypothetical protein